MAWKEDHLLRNWSCPPPWPIFIIGRWLVTCMRMFTQWMQPPVLTVFDISRGAWQTQVLHTAAELGIPDVLGRDGPQTAEQVAKKLELDSNRVYRLLRCATQMGVFAASQPKSQGEPILFRNNRLSAVLRTDHPNSLRHWCLHQAKQVKAGWDELTWAVKTGEKPFEKTRNGLNFFEWLKLNPSQEDTFSKAMKEIDNLGTRAMATDYEWNSHLRIVDIGGAYGSFLSQLLSVNKQPIAVLFDQPQVIERAKNMWAKNTKWAKLGPRVSFVAGDFFDAGTLPKAKDGDVYVIRLILHDWDDADSTLILSNIRKAIGSADAKLLIVETVIRDEFKDLAFQRGLLDLHMMVTLNGAERTVPQWQKILGNAGFEYNRITETRGVFFIVEALPLTLTV